MKINKRLTSSTNSKQILSLNKSIKNITSSSTATSFNNQDKSKLPQSQQNHVANAISSANKTQTTNMNSSRNDGCGSFVSSNIKHPSSNLNNYVINPKDSATSKLLKDIKDKIAVSAKKEGSIEKLIKLNLVNSVQSSVQQKIINANISPQSHSQVESGIESEPKIPSLKSSSKPKTKLLGTAKDIKINLISSSKVKINNPLLTSANFSFVNTSDKQHDGPVMINRNINCSKEKPIGRPLQNNNIQTEISGQHTEADMIYGVDSYVDTETKHKANINITNNYNSNIHVNTFSPPINSIYDELSKKLVKQTTNTSHKQYFTEETDLVSYALNTEERSSRKRPNHNILESENPEDLHFIQVEMLLQSKLISKKFECSDQERSPKVSPSNLPMLSVIPLDEIDL